MNSNHKYHVLVPILCSAARGESTGTTNKTTVQLGIMCTQSSCMKYYAQTASTLAAFENNWLKTFLVSFFHRTHITVLLNMQPMLYSATDVTLAKLWHLINFIIIIIILGKVNKDCCLQDLFKPFLSPKSRHICTNKTVIEKNVRCISQTSKTLCKFLLLFQRLFIQHPCLICCHSLVPLP